ncbi:thioesterase II family protein [Streptomyces sp. NPDC127072]|uniref:thioesterase II family protein n=1 Tax=Streptomyces sp. NPDC127072 TaxID=3347129 RepID=UPI0036625CCE
MSARNVVLRGAAPQDASLRVLVVPHAGAGAASGLAFAEHAPADWLVATARLPGRESRIRESVPDMPGLVADVVATARALPGPGTAPLIVVGVCSGAVIALEAVRELLRDGDGHGDDPGRADDDAGRVGGPGGAGSVAGLVVVSQWAVNEKPDPGRRLLRDTDDQAQVLDILGEFGGVPESLAANPEMLRLVLPGIVADIRAVEDYWSDPDPLLGCPLLTVFGDEDPLCPEERTAGWALFSANTRNAWVPGGHLLLAEDPAVVVDALAGNLDQFA